MSQPPPENTIHMKLCLLGDGKVGKTSLRRQYLGQGFPNEYLETLGADFSIKTTKFKYQKNAYDLRYQIWDIAGQPRFTQIRKSFYMGSQGALVLYDVTERKSLVNITGWLDELYNSNGKGNNIPVIIIGNKIDLRDSLAVSISKTEGENAVKAIQEKYNAENRIRFLETSAKTGENVDLAFGLITEMFLKMHNITL